MARQPKKTNSKDYFECPTCKSVLLDVTNIRDNTDKIIDIEYDCRDCRSSWNSRGEEL
jgi:hypothetical protein